MRFDRGRVKPLVLVAVGAFAMLAVFHSFWLARLGQALVKGGPPQPADAVLPLAGDEERLSYSAQLLAAGYAPQYALTNAALGGRNPERAYIEWARKRAAVFGADMSRVVEVPGQASTTYQEARNIRGFAEQVGWRSILIVTSSYHTRRAGVIFDEVFRGSAVRIAVVAVPNSWYTADGWWHSWRGWRATFQEYAKFVAYWLGWQ